MHASAALLTPWATRERVAGVLGSSVAPDAYRHAHPGELCPVQEPAMAPVIIASAEILRHCYALPTTLNVSITSSRAATQLQAFQRTKCTAGRPCCCCWSFGVRRKDMPTRRKTNAKVEDSCCHVVARVTLDSVDHDHQVYFSAKPLQHVAWRA
jgi:hypothetical protein